MKTKALFRFMIWACMTGLFLLANWGCSTQKNALPNRLYHSLNAKYNGYFNARENYREGLRRLSMAHIDNYDQVLHLFRYGNEQQASSISTYMDVAYQKASLVIRRHSMNIRGVEYNKWIDQSFFLIARSHFFKRDFNLAILTFEYIVRQYEGDVNHDAKVWIAKTYHQMNRYNDAAQVLEQLAKDDAGGLLGRNTQRLYSIVYADHFIRQEKYADAVPYLTKGINLTSNKREKTRLTFILAQVYQHGNDFGNAQQTYAKVLKMNPSFDLAFQARISMAMAFDPSSGGAANIEAELMRMLRDDKNKAYQDQIYYALAQLFLRQGKEEEAVKYLLRSTEESEENRLQKGLSFKLLGEIHFERPEYLKASIYYDSAVTFIPSQHEDYPVINQRKVVLSSLATNLRTIEREDSLQRLAAMTEAERTAVVDKIIEDLREEERQARLVEQQMMRAAATMARSRLQGGAGAQDGGWYFYNTTTMSFGRTEFFSMYGDRPLEDLWRISNKSTEADFDMAMGEGDLDGEQEEAGDKYDRNTYLKNIPTTPEALEISNARIANAYYNKSVVFKDQLNDYRSALNSLETLVERFPESDKQLFAYYYLYNLYRELQDVSRANVFKNKLVAEFPDSDYAKILGDPDYLEKLIERQQFAKNLYNETYRSFLNAQYHDVLEKSNQADTIEMPVDLKSQFAYIKALASGKLGKRAAFREQLESVVANYNNQPVHQPATILLASLETPGNLMIEFEDEPETETISERAVGELESVFGYKPDIIHFFVFVVGGGSVDITQIRGFVNTFNNLNFQEKNLSASSIFLDDQRQIITVTNFPDQQGGMEYYNKIMGEDGLAAFEGDNYHGFIISVENYPLFYQEKNLSEYLEFFRHYYLNM